MSYVKITSFLALVGTAAAVPHYSHGKFHSKGSDKPYPSGGWAGQYNSTVVPVAATGTGVYGEQTTTLGLTSTSTQTLVSTIYGAMPSGVPGADVPAEAAEAGESQCGGTVTVTASEKVTVTITPGADVPQSSAPAAEYPAETPEEKTTAAVETPAGGKSSAVETPVAVTSVPAAETPTQEKTTPAAGYPASTPEAATSSAASYETPDLAKKPVESAPTASSASASAAPSPSAGATYSGGKRGLAYNDANLCKSFGSNFGGFGYNWGDVENNDIGTMFVPMMHTPAKSTPEKWLGNVKTAVGKGSTAVMGFNECDHTDQCNMEPEAACAAWKQYMNPVKEAHPSVTIIGPSVTNGQAPMGLDWLTRFHDCCPDATIDATNIHFYDIYNEGTIQRFKEQVETAAKIYGKPVWITEFGLNPGSATETEAASFLKEAMEYCDGSDKVQGYSWFMVGDGENQLNAGDGLSAVGKVYAGSA